MKIYYDVPSIGTAANGWAQTGPTCWYYATKMLLRFHETIDPQAGPFYGNLKALKIFRDVYVQSKTVDFGVAVAERKDRYGRLAAVQEARQQVHASASRKAAYYHRKLRELLANLDNPFFSSAFIPQAIAELTEIVEVHQRKLQRIEQAFALDGEEIAQLRQFLDALVKVGPLHEDWNMKFVRAFFPEAFFLEIEYRNGLTEFGAVYELLEKWGPLLMAGWVSSAGGIAPLDGYHEVKQFSDTGRHVIVLTGIDTETGIVEFKDPNFSSRICWCHYHELIVRIDGADLGKQISVFTAVRCAEHGNCAHMQRRKRNESFAEVLEAQRRQQAVLAEARRRQEELLAPQALLQLHDTANSVIGSLGLDD